MQQQGWYDKPTWVYLSLLCPPVALYALYKNTTWEQKKKRQFYGYALILVVLQLAGIAFGPSQEERNARAAAENIEKAEQVAAGEKAREEQATAKARDNERLANVNSEKKEFLDKYRSFGAPKILYRCGDEIAYSVGVGTNATYNRLISEAREKCEQFDWQKGQFKILEGQQ